MNYEQFVTAMLECAREKLGNAAVVEKQEILRNNDVTMIGLSIREQGKNAAPIIYLEQFYEKYCLGASVDFLTEYFIRKSREAAPAPVWEYESILDFRKIKHRIVYKLINAERNRKFLKMVPHLPIMDLAIVFCVLIPAEGTDTCSVLIRNAHMEYWKIPVSLLYQCAKINTPKLCPPVLYPLSDFIEAQMGELREECPLYILSNQAGINGAAAILYPEIPAKIYEALGSCYYLLPSSVHEFLIYPKNDSYTAEELRHIVQEVNENHIAEEELLSDNVYFFDGNNITNM